MACLWKIKIAKIVHSAVKRMLLEVLGTTRGSVQRYRRKPDAFSSIIIMNEEIVCPR